jgi:hypothetical protein
MLPRALLVTLLVATALAAAGCVKNEAAPSAPSNGNDHAAPPPSDDGRGSNPPPPPARTPTSTHVSDKGSIQGTFEHAWAIAVPAISPKDFTVDFALASAEAGAPVTAIVTLVLTDPDGKLVKTETIGLGQPHESVAWSLAPGDVMKTGDWKLKATAQAPAGTEGIPSAGVAAWTLAAAVDY